MKRFNLSKFCSYFSICSANWLLLCLSISPPGQTWPALLLALPCQMKPKLITNWSVYSLNMGPQGWIDLSRNRLNLYSLKDLLFGFPWLKNVFLIMPLELNPQSLSFVSRRMAQEQQPVVAYEWLTPIVNFLRINPIQQPQFAFSFILSGYRSFPYILCIILCCLCLLLSVYLITVSDDNI